MGIKTAINSPRGRLAIAFLLGFGLSTLFRKSCKDETCMKFKAPPLKKVEKAPYKFEDKCSLFKSQAAKCDDTKRIVQF